MPDRRRRAALLLPPPAFAGRCPQPAAAPGAVLLRERKQSSDSAGTPGSSDRPGSSGTGGSPGSSEPAGSPDATDGTDPAGHAGTPARERAHSRPRGQGRNREQDGDNPFAPPPADAPDQLWQPRHPQQGQGQDGEQEQSGDRQSWGSQWSSRQPGRQGGGFGTRQGGGRGGQQGPGGQGGPGSPGGPGGLRWDPTDPAQRRARYALLAGMWGFFFVLFNLPEISLLLAALALYWGISSLRAKPARAGGGARATAADVSGQAPPRTDAAGASATGSAPAPGSTRPQTTAAVAGLVTASLALVMVAATFTLQFVYRDYFTCVNDALTKSAAQSCEKLLPEQLRPLLSAQQE
ncbi:hypothetical protein [Streptomyces sp. NPDC007100]|uniref:hypothetical protein n=1 Tax=Streptomyces sp. NPDC007100 TaxID=3155602 RepID=UPI0033EAA48E